MKRIYIAAVLIFSLTIIHLNAQGCSDAGFCTMPGVKHGQSDDYKKHKLSLGISYGKGDLETKVIGSYLAWNYMFSEDIDVSLKTTFQSVEGPLGTLSGLSDIFFTGTYRLPENWFFSGGLKIPFSRSDNSDYSMEYQNSIGTFDLLAGGGWEKNHLGFALGLQLPLDQNKFQYEGIESYKRKGDVFLRVYYKILFENSPFSLTPTILPIYHLGNDTFVDVNNQTHEIDGSSGLTLNLNLFAGWKLDDSSKIELSLAAPLVVRDTRPDGLTRSFFASVEYSFGF